MTDNNKIHDFMNRIKKEDIYKRNIIESIFNGIRTIPYGMCYETYSNTLIIPWRSNREPVVWMNKMLRLKENQFFNKVEFFKSDDGKPNCIKFFDKLRRK